MLKKFGNKGCLVVTMAAAGLLVLVACWLLGQSRLQRAYTELRSQELPTNAAELDTYYAVPAGTKDTTELWTKAAAAVAAAKIDQSAAKLPFVGMGATPIPQRGQPWAELEDARDFLSELKPQLEVLRRAAEAGGMARYPDDFRKGLTTSITNMQTTRTMARLLTLSAHVHLHGDDEQLALLDVRGLFAVSESLQRSPVLISGLIRLAIHSIGCELAAELLPQTRWSDSDLQQLQMEISKAQFREELLGSFHGERAICLEAISTSPGILFRDANLLKIIELFEILTDGLTVSWSEATKAHREIEGEIQALSGGGFITRTKFMTLRLLLPAITQGVVASMRAEARQNCLIATIAAYRYRLKHGKLPPALVDLTEFLPGDDSRKSSLLTDPFDGQPLRLKIEDTRLVIYSIGQNLVDDGGQIETEKPADGDCGYAVRKIKDGL